MLRNADISYSSITPNQRTNSCLCCFCTFDCSHCKCKSCHPAYCPFNQTVICCQFTHFSSLSPCCRSCFLRLPYGTITSTLLAACGLIISIVSILHSTNIVDRLTHDLIRRKYYWLSDLKVWYIVLTIFVSVIIVINILIGFATTGSAGKKGKPCRTCGCTTASTTTFLIKCIFVINYILFYFLLLLAVIVFITLFICYILTDLCNDGTRVILNQNAERPYPSDTRPGHYGQYIDLRQFSPTLALRSNETEFLYFKDDRLKKLCGDYVSALMFYMILCSVGMILLCSGFVNFLINLSVNWVRLSTKQKYAEIMYLNGAEMTAFNEGTGDHTSRY